jgi:hypothetical protein
MPKKSDVAESLVVFFRCRRRIAKVVPEEVVRPVSNALDEGEIVQTINGVCEALPARHVS